MRENNNKNNFFFIILIQLLLLFPSNQEDLSECLINTPISKNGQCTNEYCTKEQFESKVCLINNTIIKTQWLNNIIFIGNSKFRYINFASYSNGDMIIETTSYPATATRMFYGLKKNGRPFFKDNQKETPYYIINVTGQENKHYGKYEAASLIIKSSENGSGNGKEYYFSISKLDCYGEIFDFENNKIYNRSVAKFTSFTYTKTFRHTIIPMIPTSSKYYYLFGFIKGDKAEDYTNAEIFFQRHSFKNITNFLKSKTYDTVNISISNGYGNIVSCFQTDNKLIICFYLTFYSDINKYFLNLIKFGQNLKNNITYSFNYNSESDLIFYKCVHLKGEVGVFVYFDSFSWNSYPVLLFKEFDIQNNEFKSYLSSSYNDSSIVLMKKRFNKDVLMNDLIRINENKVCLCTIYEDKQTIYIILVNAFGDKKVRIRYYSIQSYPLYNYKIYL